VIEIDKGVVGPELGAEFVARHKIAGAFDQSGQYKKRLALEAKLDALLAEFSGAHVELKSGEAQDGFRLRVRHELGKWFTMFSNQVEDVREIEFVPLYRAIDKSIAVRRIHLDEKAIASEKDIGGGESHALVAVNKAAVTAKGFHQGSGFFFEGIVVADLGTKNSSLYGTLLTDSMEAAEHFD